MGDRPTIFISYSPDDAALKDELLKHLNVLKRVKNVEVWTPDCIPAGDDLRTAMAQALERSSVVLLLVSASWLVMLEEDAVLLELLTAHSSKGQTLVPIILHSCLWKEEPLIARFQPIPRGGRPLAHYEDRNDPLHDVVEEVTALLKDRTTSETRGSSIETPSSRQPRRDAAPAFPSGAPESNRDGIKFSFKFKKLKVLFSLSLGVLMALMVSFVIVGQEDPIKARDGGLRDVTGVVTSYIESLDGGLSDADAATLDGGLADAGDAGEISADAAADGAADASVRLRPTILRPSGDAGAQPTCKRQGWKCMQMEECCSGICKGPDGVAGKCL